VYSFLYKFATNSCKRFPPHLNNVSTLPCESWNAQVSCCRKTPEFIPWPPNSPDLNTVDYSVWKILQETVYKTYVTDLDKVKKATENGVGHCDRHSSISVHQDWLWTFAAPFWLSSSYCLWFFCCRCWRHEQLRAICRPVLTYCPLWRCDVILCKVK